MSGHEWNTRGILRLRPSKWVGTRAWDVSGKTSVVQLLSHVQLFVTPCNPMGSTWGSPLLHCLWSLLRFMSIESMMLSNHLILCHSLPLLPSIFPNISFFSNETAIHIRWPKYFSFSFSLSPSNEYSGLISFRINWFDLLAVQGTLKSLRQHHNSKTSILPRHSAFFMVQHSDP